MHSSEVEMSFENFSNLSLSLNFSNLYKIRFKSNPNKHIIKKLDRKLLNTYIYIYEVYIQMV